jgi:aryl-alcohol dehydrogenase-like predicted oxidoreductase
MPVLHECAELGIAFAAFFPLGSAFGGVNRVLTHPDVVDIATRLAVKPAQVALAWILHVSPNTLLIPGTSSVEHLHDNLTVGRVHFDDDTLKTLDAITL